MGKRKSKKGSGKGSTKPQTNFEGGNPMMDEVDEFHEQRDQIALEKIGSRGDDGSDDEEDMVQDVMGLGSDVERSSSDEEDNRGGRKSQAAKREELDWGGKRNYYGADTVDYEVESDPEVAEMEEQETMRIQREQAEGLEEGDFDYGDMLDAVVEADEGKKGKKGKDKKSKKDKSKKDAKPKKKSRKQKNDELLDAEQRAEGGAQEEDTTSKKKSKKKSKKEKEGKKKSKKDKGKKKSKKGKKAEEEEAVTLLADLDSVQLSLGEEDEEEVEHVEKDLTELSEAEKRESLLADAPELMGLLDEFKAKMSELRTQMAPLRARVKKGELPTGKGISFLEVKYHLLLTYCTNLVFYFMLKAEGRNVSKHPVIEQLVKLRVMLTKIRPIDKQLSYQVEKLLQTAALGGESRADPLQFKPNAANLASKLGDDDDDSDGEGEAGVYQPPRLAAAEFIQNDKAARRARLDKEKARKKASASSLVRHLRDELLDLPEEVSAVGMDVQNQGAAKEHEARERERREFEEDNFMRLMETKEDKRRRMKAKKKMNALEEFDDFGDLSALMESQQDEQLNLSSLRGKSAGERFIEQNQKKRKSLPSFLQDSSDDEDDMAAGQQLYDEVQSSSKKKKKQRKEQYPKPESRYPKVDYDAAGDEDRRAITRKIHKPGLLPYRRRDIKTPKTRNRARYDNALIKRRSQVRDFAGKTPSYGGEASGIKATVTKSTSLKT